MAISKSTASSISPAAKGDLVVGSGTNDAAVLGVGTNDQVLTADSSTATGLKWATVAAGANWSLVNSGGTALTGASTITISGISNADKIMVLWSGASSATAAQEIYIRLNGDTGSNYTNMGPRLRGYNTYDVRTISSISDVSTTTINIGAMGSDTSSVVNGYVMLSGCNNSGSKIFHTASSGNYSGGGVDQIGRIGGGFWNNSATVTSVSIITQSGNFDAGTIYVYTSA